MADRVKIAVVDGQPLFRKGLVDTISSSGLLVVAEGETADDAARIVQQSKPDILILDISIFGDGLGAAAAALRKRSTLKIVILTASDNKGDVAEALRIGAQGYILKGVSGPQLLEALGLIQLGERYITPALAARLIMQSRGKSLLADKASDIGLTLRDRRVLRHLAKGLSNQELALELGVNIRTIKTYLSQIFRKLEVRSRVEAVLEAQKIRLDLSDEAQS